MGAALLLLLNPGSRAVRWYSLFVGSLLLWLLLQGILLTAGLTPFWTRIYFLNVHLMPALFLGATLARRPGGAALLPIAAPAAGVLLAAVPGFMRSPWEMLWQAVLWGAAAVVYVRDPGRATRTPAARRLGLVLGGLVPFGVVGAILLEGGFVLYVLPCMTIAVQLLIFVGVVHHRFYDIEVRAARTGALAAAAARQERLALLGELSATVAHEVRNPLTGMRSLTQMLAEGEVDDAQRRRYTGVILEEITRLERFVGSLTDTARRSSAGSADAVEPTPLRPLFEDLLLLVEPQARRAGVAVVRSSPDLAVHASRDALAQVLLNLLLNAIGHSPAGGTVRLDARADTGGVGLRVRDQGPGVPQPLRERIFEPFHSEGGTGLGLAVVRRIAEEHGWSVRVADAPGGGAEFHLLVPGSP